jgi:hypothetical protein
MLIIFNKSNAQIIILEFRSRLEDMNIINKSNAQKRTAVDSLKIQGLICKRSRPMLIGLRVDS